MKSNVNNESNKSQVQSNSNTVPKSGTKKTFKIPDDIKSFQVKTKLLNR